MTDDEILEVVQAHMQGKKIEYRELYLRENGRWIPADTSDLWDFINRRYRVAPEPRKPRVLDLVYEGGGIWKELYPISIGIIGKSVRFREVL